MLNFVKGESQAMKEAWKKVVQASESDVPVLLWGETGTGKSLVAELIHRKSPRRKQHMLTLDCATISFGLMESELFGHEKGAFTGATSSKKGLVEEAHGSTLFLEEVGNIEPAVQVKLLTVLEKKSFRRLGGTRELKADFRLISATNRDLWQMVEAGTFRRDLYYRLKVIEIYLPPLRERREDIWPLVEFWLKECSRRRGKSLNFSEEAKEVLINYPWPGNVRELKNLIEALLTTGEGGVVGPDELPLEIHRAAVVERATSREEYMSLRSLEREYIERVLRKFDYRIRQTARILGISRNTLKEKIRKYGIEVKK